MKKSNQLMSWVFRSLMVSLIVIFVLSSQDSFADNKKSLSGDEKAAEVKEAFLGIKPPAPLSEERKKKIINYLNKKDKAWNFDAELGLYFDENPKTKAKWAGYLKRKKLKKLPPLHSIRWSLMPCFGRIASGDPEQMKKALKTIDTVLSCQITDPESKNYGWWPLYLEMPLDFARSNHFLSNALLAILHYYRNDIPPELAARIDAALVHAGKGLITEKDHLGWTNAAMGSIYLLLTLGEKYNIPEAKERGMYILKGMYDLTKWQGSFSEYNSPSYMPVNLHALLKIMKSVKDEKALRLVRELYYDAWEHIAIRYHFPTGQWSGPHSRNYGNLLAEPQVCLFESALSEKPVLSAEVSRDWAMIQHLNQHQIPKSLRHYFVSRGKPREVVQTFKIETQENKKHLPNIIGTTYMTDNFSFGTVNRSQMWEQNRNFMVYFGSKKAPSYLRPRFMKGDFDFAAVQYFSVQDKARALVALNFSNNGGDKHVSKDRIRGKFSADNLRLRFEIGGNTDGIKISVPDSSQGIAKIETKDKGLCFFIKAPIALFDGAPCKWVSGKNEDTLFLDLVLYDGPKKLFKLKKLKESIIGFAFAISDFEGKNVAMQDVSAKLADGKWVMKWDGLSLTTATIPDDRNKLQAEFDGSVNGISRREYPVKR